MKTSKVVCLVACGLSFSVFANYYADWFSGTATSATGAAWNKVSDEWPTGVSVEGNKIMLANDASSMLSLTPTADKSSGKVVVVESTAELTPSDFSELPSSIEGAQVGFAVAIEGTATNFCGFANGAWHKLTGATPPESGDTTFKFEINYSTLTKTVKFYVGTTLLSGTVSETPTTEFAIGNYTKLNDVACFGSGSLTSINADVQTMIAKYNGHEYATFAEALAVEGANPDNILVAGVEDGTQTFAANGMKLWQCLALGFPTNNAAAKIAPVPVEKDTATDGITLQASLTPAETELDIKLQVMKDGVAVNEACPPNAIKIPLATGKYTLEPVITAKSSEE